MKESFSPEHARNLANNHHDEKAVEAFKHAIMAIRHSASQGNFMMEIHQPSYSCTSYITTCENEPFDRSLIYSYRAQVAERLAKLGYVVDVREDESSGLSYLYVGWEA